MKKLSRFYLCLLTFWDFSVTDLCGGNLFTLTQTCWHLSAKKHSLSSIKNIGMTFTNICTCQQVQLLTNSEPLKYCVLWIEWEILLLQVFFFILVTTYLSVLIRKIPRLSTSLLSDVHGSPWDNSRKEYAMHSRDGIDMVIYKNKDTTIP